MKSVLVIQLGGIGDVCMSLPAITSLGETYGKVNVLIRETAKDILKGNVHVSGIFSIPRSRAPVVDIFNQWASLGRRGFDVAVNLSPSRMAAIIARRGSFTVGMTRRSWRWKPPAYSRSVDWEEIKHLPEPCKFLRIAELAGTREEGALCFPLFLSEGETAAALDKLQIDAEGPRKRCVGFAFGGMRGGVFDTRVWPREKWFLLARKLLNQGCAVIALGDEKDADWFRPMPSNIVDLCGKSTLRETAAVAAALDCLVASDNGIMHVPWSYTPVVALCSDYTLEMGAQPLGELHRVIHNSANVPAISVEEVYTNIQDVLQKNPPASHPGAEPRTLEWPPRTEK